MSFLTPAYFGFFPLVILGNFLLPQRARPAWLLLASWFFCLCAGPASLAFLLCASVFAYCGGRLLEARQGRARKGTLALLLCLAFGTLFLFKYLNFALLLAARALSLLGLQFEGVALDLLLPAGISFYLFQAAGYLIDIYRGEEKAERHVVRFALFLSFFPQMLSGPIARAKGLLPQLRQPPRFDYDRFRAGLLRFLWGAFVKLVLADRLAMLVNPVFAAPQQFGAMNVALAALAFSLQIYCDFSAYSHMALGSAEAMGYSLMENFRSPYFARSVAEFWRRWHISLSSWFRDYLYFPLGGSRGGKWRQYRNILLVFAVSGLWHGAALSFLVWGLLNGIYQVLGSMTHRPRARLRAACGLKDESLLCGLWQRALTFGLLTLAWIFFKAGSLGAALAVLRSIFLPTALRTPWAGMGLGWQELLVVGLGLLLLLVVDLYSLRAPVRTWLLARGRPLRWLLSLGLLLLVCLFGVYGTGYDPQDFIYFKF